MPSRQLKRNNPETDHEGYSKETNKKAKGHQGEENQDDHDQAQDIELYEEK